MLHIPLLRRGRPYRSLDVAHAVHHATREPFVEISQANVGLIRRDLLPREQDAMRASLAQVRSGDLVDICKAAAPIFLDATLSIGDVEQTPHDFVRQVSATTGMPHVMVRRNMQRVAAVMTHVGKIVRGLTRGVDLDVLDDGVGDVQGHTVSFFPRTRALGVVLPSNSPGVHGLWVPALAMKTPLVLRPGAAEPWTPYRILQALMQAGLPPDAVNYLPSDHAGAGEIVRQCGRSMFFGDVAAVGAFAGDPRIELHGPGYSKIVLGPDQAADWAGRLDLIAASVAENGGRSCVNASGVWTPAHGREIADALARRLAAIVPRAADDPNAEIAPFVDPRVARHIDQQIAAGLAEPGAEDLTAIHRDGPRLVEFAGCTYLLPTVIHCTSSTHPLANREFLFPYVSVVDVSAEEAAALPACLGPTLVVTALTGELALINRLLGSDLVGRLNIGPIQTNTIAWDQPHEGNLFDHLYAGEHFSELDRRMRLLYLTAGAAEMYCGSCLRDNALAAALKSRGHDVVLTPVYTPTTTDEPNVSDSHVLFGGVSVYLEQHVPLFRHTPAALDRLWDSTTALRLASKRQIKVDPSVLGAMTVSMLRGSKGHQKKEVGKMLQWLSREAPFDAISLPFTLLIGLAKPLRDALHVPIVCTLQGEDLFLGQLQEPWKSQALGLIRGAVADVDAFISVSEYYTSFMAGYLGIDPSRIRTVPLGITLSDVEPAPARMLPPFTIGFFGRVSPEKGLHVLADAYRRLRAKPGVPPTTLLAAGYLLNEHRPYLAEIEQRLHAAGIGSEFRYAGAPDRAGKLAAFREMDVFSMPATYDEPKGLSVLEAMAHGVPVVQPRRGAFTEIVTQTGGGLLVTPDDPDALANGLYTLLIDRARATALGRAGMEGVRRAYAIDHMAAAAERVYESLHHGGRSR